MVSRNLKREDKTIEQFCWRLSKIECHRVQIIERPDRDNPRTGGCDAIIERGKRRFALEHTTIDSFLNQRADAARFRQVVVPLEQSIRSVYLDSCIEIMVPVYAIPKGEDWLGITERLHNSCVKVIEQMSFNETQQQFTFAEIPFPVWITRRENHRNPACYVMYKTPDNLAAQIVKNISKAIYAKRNQLAPYRQQGLPTILLLDSDDTALVNLELFADAFRKVADCESTEGLDEIFIAEADRNPIWYYPVKLYNRTYPNLPEFQQFFETQYILTYRSPE